MRVLYLLRSSPDETIQRIIEVQREENEVKVIDLSQREVDYEWIIQEIFSHDRVISW